MNNKYIIETKRLYLRHLKDSDVNSVFNNYANDDEVTKYLSWPSHKSIETTKAVFEMWKKDDEIKKKYHFLLF